MFKNMNNVEEENIREQQIVVMKHTHVFFSMTFTLNACISKFRGKNVKESGSNVVESVGKGKHVAEKEPIVNQ